jgi:hypothetical protein
VRVGPGKLATPTFSHLSIEAPRNDQVPSKLDTSDREILLSPERSIRRLTDNGYDDTRSFDSPPTTRSPTRSTHELFDEPPRLPAMSRGSFESPACSAAGFPYEPTRSPIGSTRGLFNEAPTPPAMAMRFETLRSPAIRACGCSMLDEPPRSPTRSTLGMYYEPASPPAGSLHSFEQLGITESDQISKPETGRSAELEKQRLEKEEDNRLAAQEAAMISALEQTRRTILAREEERDLRDYVAFQKETANAQKGLATVQEELNAVEARRAEMGRRLESAHMEETSCRYYNQHIAPSGGVALSGGVPPSSGEKKAPGLKKKG